MISNLREANLIWRYTDGDVIAPWYALPALEWLKQQDTSKWRVFEYGCGYSTIWWRLNCSKVVSVDNNEVWAKAMNAICEKEKDNYIHASLNYSFANKHDCIIIDGEWRDECTVFCLDYIKPGGYLIIDNYEQYDVGFNYDNVNLLLEGWEKTVHKQYNHSTWATAVFRKPL